MAWLKLDDKFAHHPKVLALTDKEFRAHITAMCYCSAHFTRGVVPSAAFKSLGVSTRILTKLCDVGLWDRVETDFKIHDFELYNGDVDERVTAYLEQNPNASANDVCRAIGGKREAVLAVLKRFRDGSQTVPEQSPQGTDPADEVVPEEPADRFLPDPDPTPIEQDQGRTRTETTRAHNPDTNGNGPGEQDFQTLDPLSVLAGVTVVDDDDIPF